MRLDHLQQNRITAQHSASQEAHLPLKNKMAKFHKEIATLSLCKTYVIIECL